MPSNLTGVAEDAANVVQSVLLNTASISGRFEKRRGGGREGREVRGWGRRGRGAGDQGEGLAGGERRQA